MLTFELQFFFIWRMCSTLPVVLFPVIVDDGTDFTFNSMLRMCRPFQAKKRANCVLSVKWTVCSIMSCISSTETAGTTSLSLFSLSSAYSSQCCGVFGPPCNRLPPKSLFTFSSHVPRRKLSDAGLLMFMLSTCQSRGELSGSGSVNWALIRCCSN